MSAKSPRSLANLITADGTALRQLADTARGRVDLADHLRAGLDPALAEQLTGCNLRDDGTLVVLASGPDWAARLRYESDDLLARCRQRHPGAGRVRVRVAHSTASPAD